MTTTTFDEGPIRAHTLIVSAKVDGTFRRAGRTFTRESVDIPLAELSDDELEALLKEPLLYTAFVGDAADAPPQETETHANPPSALENPPPVPSASTAASAAGPIAGDGTAGPAEKNAETGTADQDDTTVTGFTGLDDGDARAAAAAAVDAVQPPVTDLAGTDQLDTPESDPSAAATGAAHESVAPGKAAPKRTPAKAATKKAAAK